MQRGLSKSLRKFNLLMDKVIKNKRGLELMTSHSSGYKTSPEKLLVLHYLTNFDYVYNI